MVPAKISFFSFPLHFAVLAGKVCPQKLCHNRGSLYARCCGRVTRSVFTDFDRMNPQKVSFLSSNSLRGDARIFQQFI